MSILNTYGRPVIKFDAENPIHRQYYADFVKASTWKDCPVRFKVEENFVDTTSMIKHHITDYYFRNDPFINF